MGKIRDFSTAISVHEGFGIAGSIAQRNRNPGNIIFGDLAKRHGATTFWKHPKTGHEFAIFPTVEQGFSALDELITNACTGKSQIYSPLWTILQFFTKYSPIRNSAGVVIPNVNYAADVAKRVGVSMYTKIKDLVDNINTPISSSAENGAPKIMIQIENQLDKKWARYYIGTAKGYSFAGNACFLFSLTYLYSVKMGKQISPAVVDQMFIDGGVYSGPMINSKKAAQVLGLQYFGKEYDINNPPDWSPSIKEVDFSIKGGKQQHFVVRCDDETGKYIFDPYQGVRRAVNFYEKKVAALNWQTGNFSYRKFKI